MMSEMVDSVIADVWQSQSCGENKDEADARLRHWEKWLPQLIEEFQQRELELLRKLEAAVNARFADQQSAALTKEPS